MSICTYPAVIDALKTALGLRAGLTGVQIFTAPAGETATSREVIEFEGMVTDELPATMGGTREETYTLTGGLLVTRAGSGDTVAKAARDRAFTILGEIESYINDNYAIGGTCLDANLVRFEATQGYGPQGRVCGIEFKIEVQSLINP